MSSIGWSRSLASLDFARLTAGMAPVSPRAPALLSVPMLASAPKLVAGDRVAILSPSFAAPGFAPTVHEQAMLRLVAEIGLVPVEYPTTRRLGSTPEDRAADINSAFADPSIRAILATVGGNDQITVIPHLDAEAVAANPKPFLGYSDNAHLLNWLWSLGICGYYGGSTQVHLGAGPEIDAVHRASLNASLFTGGELEVVDPGVSEDFGRDWLSPLALTEFGEREPTDAWTWSEPERVVEGRTWVQRWVRGLGERGILGVVAGVMVARPPVSSHEEIPAPEERQRLRAAQREVIAGELARYNPEAVVCFGVPFGHTRPQWILPYGGSVRLDGRTRQVTANYN